MAPAQTAAGGAGQTLAGVDQEDGDPAPPGKQQQQQQHRLVDVDGCRPLFRREKSKKHFFSSLYQDRKRDKNRAPGLWRPLTSVFGRPGM